MLNVKDDFVGLRLGRRDVSRNERDVFFWSSVWRGWALDDCGSCFVTWETEEEISHVPGLVSRRAAPGLISSEHSNSWLGPKSCSSAFKPWARFLLWKRMKGTSTLCSLNRVKRSVLLLFFSRESFLSFWSLPSKLRSTWWVWLRTNLFVHLRSNFRFLEPFTMLSHLGDCPFLGKVKNLKP